MLDPQSTFIYLQKSKNALRRSVKSFIVRVLTDPSLICEAVRRSLQRNARRRMMQQLRLWANNYLLTSARFAHRTDTRCMCVCVCDVSDGPNDYRSSHGRARNVNWPLQSWEFASSRWFDRVNARSGISSEFSMVVVAKCLCCSPTHFEATFLRVPFLSSFIRTQHCKHIVGASVVVANWKRATPLVPLGKTGLTISLLSSHASVSR